MSRVSRDEKVATVSASCPVATTLGVVGGKWKLAAMWHLLDGVLRFGQLQRRLPGVTPQMLTQQLRELERDGLVRREVFPEVPPKVEYSLTDYGRTLAPILKEMCAWGVAHQRRA